MDQDLEPVADEQASAAESPVDDTIDDQVRSAIAEARTWIAEAERVVALTGAGISTDSGIPDFRGPNGVWTRNPGAEKASTLSFYMSDPDVRRASWRSRVELGGWKVEPNAGHHALVTLERNDRLDTLVTQNIDGLHQAAGSDPDRVVEIHGTVREVVCMSCDERGPMDQALARVEAGEDDPPCLTCGGILKSATISFGQNLVQADLERADQAARDCDLLLAVGSTLSVYPIADMVPVARMSGARVVIVNGGETAMDDLADSVLRGRIGTILPALAG